MYKIIGIDGLQYGPVSAEQIKQWIAAGRADAETRAQEEGSIDWKPLFQLSEFADAFSSKAAPAPPQLDVPPPLAETRVTALEKSVAERKTSIDVGSCLGRAWDLLMSDLWTIIGITALVWLALTVTHTVHVGLLVTGPLLGGLYFYYLKKIRGHPAELQDAFAGFTLSFVQLMLASLVSFLLTVLGLLICLIPGIYLAVTWSFALPLVIDKRLGFWEAMELSRKAVDKRWWSVAWLLLVCGLINVGGSLLCCVGIFFTLPLTMIATTYAYEDVFRLAPTETA
jgi:hypothetical protein